MKCVNIKLWDILGCFNYILNAPRTCHFRFILTELWTLIYVKKMYNKLTEFQPKFIYAFKLKRSRLGL